MPSEFADGRGNLWWLALEKVINDVDELQVRMEGDVRRFVCGTTQEKERTYHVIYWWLRRIDEKEARTVVRELCRGAGFDPAELSRELLMTWDELRSFSHDPIVTIGAHTVSHYALAKLSEAEARQEIEMGARRIEQELGRRPLHLSYPYGGEESAGPREFQIARELGFKTAVTTRKGSLHAEHDDTSRRCRGCH